MKNAVFFDIDGTLWDNNMQIPDSTVAAIRELQAGGSYAFLCSGRSRANIKSKHLLDIGFDGIVAACGTSIEYRGESILEQLFSKEQVEHVLWALKAHNIPAVLEGPEYIYVNPDEFLDDPYVIYLREELKEQVADIGTDCSKIVINKLSAALKGADVEKFKQDLGAAYDVIIHEDDIIEINLHGHSKATGIEKVCELLHIPHENTYAFGDSANDLEMLSYVAHGIAMGNGTAVAKKAAEYITTDIHADGIAHGLRHYGLII